MRRMRLVLAVILAIGSVPAAASTASAAQPVISTYTAMSGVPSHVPAKGTLAFTLTFTQHSSYRLYIDGLAFEVWNTCLCNPDNTEGKTATYLDPTTGTWRVTAPAAGDSFGAWLNERLLVSPGQVVSIPVRLNVTGFRNGTYKLADNGTAIGNALDGQGSNVTFTWQHYEAGDKKFTIGTVTTTSPTRTTVTPRKSLAPQTSPSASSSPSAVPSPSPHLSEPAATFGDTPSVAVATAVSARTTSSRSWWWLTALPVLAAGLVVARRRRRPAEPDAVTEPQDD
jgi:hypothetical protein